MAENTGMTKEMVVNLKDFHEPRHLHSFADKAIIECSEDNIVRKFFVKEETTAGLGAGNTNDNNKLVQFSVQC